MQWLYLDANQQQVSTEEEHLGDLVQAGHIQADTMLWNETMTDWQSAQSIWPDTFQAAPAVAAPTVPKPHPPGGAPVMKRRGAKPLGRPSRSASTSAGRKTSVTATGRKTASAAKTSVAAKKQAGQVEEDVEEINAVTKRFAIIFSNYHGWIMAVAVMSMILGAMVVFGGIASLVGNPHFLAVIPIVLGVIPIGISVLLMKAAGFAKLGAGTGFPANLDHCLEQLGKYFVGIGIFLIVLLTLIVVGIALAIFSPGLLVGA